MKLTWKACASWFRSESAALRKGFEPKYMRNAMRRLQTKHQESSSFSALLGGFGFGVRICSPAVRLLLVAH